MYLFDADMTDYELSEGEALYRIDIANPCASCNFIAPDYTGDIIGFHELYDTVTRKVWLRYGKRAIVTKLEKIEQA